MPRLDVPATQYGPLQACAVGELPDHRDEHRTGERTEQKGRGERGEPGCTHAVGPLRPGRAAPRDADEHQVA